MASDQQRRDAVDAINTYLRSGKAIFDPDCHCFDCEMARDETHA